jgi:hypothetical protein
MVANAVIKEDGTFQDKGNAKVRASRVTTSDLYDNDNNSNRGIGGQFKRAPNEEGQNQTTLQQVPLQYGYDNSNRTVKATIGTGAHNIGGIISRS